MEFETAYSTFVTRHYQRRGGNSAERIKDGLQHAEKKFAELVWWPAFRQFDNLHPEYEIRDFNGGVRYLDFAYVQPRFRIAMEIDGFGPHWKDISQEDFSDHCRRQNHLVIDGWYVLRFSFNDITRHPRQCQQTIQQLIGRITGNNSRDLELLHPVDLAIVRLASTTSRPMTVKEVSERILLERHAVARRLRRLSKVGWLKPSSGNTRIRTYQLDPSRANIQL